MKARGVISGLCVVGVAVAAVCAVVLHTGRPAVPTAEANAAEPAKPGEPAKGVNYNWQYESTKPRTVLGPAADKYVTWRSGQRETMAGEYEVQTFASRGRDGVAEVYLVWVRKRWVKVEGVDQKEWPPNQDCALLASDAASAVAFIEGVKDAKRSKGEQVNFAWIKWEAKKRTLYGGVDQFDPATPALSMLCHYDSVVTVHGNVLALSSTDRGSLALSATDLTKIFTEGLKDVASLKKAEWSPAP